MITEFELKNDNDMNISILTLRNKALHKTGSFRKIDFSMFTLLIYHSLSAFLSKQQS